MVHKYFKEANVYTPNSHFTISYRMFGRYQVQLNLLMQYVYWKII